ncbi:hypothetical protein C2E21_8745 [Chlorella sorokiniana]|uniref:Uncharacterized protein n=1 Tax=Chlorella sorokiniana TaxID=3076 RepID=A0A2P6TDM0_CHLSO|nr:hypothetical protein C2E21_8745 [Chlorella sorokiniana]|eukprot:PRW20722.1 hypothetical protein C2E21_8745 [Chlorella sorokiniana]
MGFTSYMMFYKADKAERQQHLEAHRRAAAAAAAAAAQAAKQPEAQQILSAAKRMVKK